MLLYGLDGFGHGFDVEHGGLGGHEHEIGHGGGVVGDLSLDGSAVDDDQVGALLFGGLEYGGQPHGLDGDDGWRLLTPGVVPERGCGLGIEVNQGDGFAVCLGGNGKTGGECGLAHTALLGKNCKHFHGVYPYTFIVL